MQWHVHSGLVISISGTLSRSGAACAGTVVTIWGTGGVMMGGVDNCALSLLIALLRHKFRRLVLPEPGTKAE